MCLAFAMHWSKHCEQLAWKAKKKRMRKKGQSTNPASHKQVNSGRLRAQSC
jgi:hypothetical protein